VKKSQRQRKEKDLEGGLHASLAGKIKKCRNVLIRRSRDTGRKGNSDVALSKERSRVEKIQEGK